eukprot:5902703-Pyramimonas_sp.AAC.1
MLFRYFRAAADFHIHHCAMENTTTLPRSPAYILLCPAYTDAAGSYFCYCCCHYYPYDDYYYDYNDY